MEKSNGGKLVFEETFVYKENVKNHDFFFMEQNYVGHKQDIIKEIWSDVVEDWEKPYKHQLLSWWPIGC